MPFWSASRPLQRLFGSHARAGDKEGGRAILGQFALSIVHVLMVTPPADQGGEIPPHEHLPCPLPIS